MFGRVVHIIIDKSKDGSLTVYFQLEHPKNEAFLPQLEDIKDEINQLIILSVKLFRKLDDDKY